MDTFLNSSIPLLIAIQHFGAWLAAPMKFFTFLGTEDFFILLVPALYWCIDSAIGLRMGIILLLSSGLNSILKLTFHTPRPTWVSTQIHAGTSESSFGMPSGHAQNAAAVWGYLASAFRKKWAWGIAIGLMFLIGTSRLYLGVHFPPDVLAGWLIGGLFLLAWIRLEKPVTQWLKTRTSSQVILLALAVSLGEILLAAGLRMLLSGWQIPAAWLANAQTAFPGAEVTPTSLNATISMAAMFFGMAVGVVWLHGRGGFSVQGKLWQRGLRLLLGLIGIIIIWMGLGVIFPRTANLIGYSLRFLRYGLAGFWVTGLAPAIFKQLKLA